MITSTRPLCHFWRRQSGLSLIELMVAMAMGLILMAGLIGVVVSSQTANRAVSNMGGMQEGGRFAAEFLAQSLVMADHWGGIESDEVSVNAGLITAVGGCDGDWVTDLENSLRGYEGAGNIGAVAGFPANCISNIHYTPDTDILTIKYAGTSGMALDHSQSDNKDRLYIRTRTGSTSTLFNGDSDVSAAYPIEDGWAVYPFVIETYFISPCSNLGATGGGACDDGVPTLVRHTINKNSSNALQLRFEPLVENIETLQFQYGSDTDADGDVDRFDSADNVPDWTEVQTVRFTFLVRSAEAENSYADNKSYALDGYMASGAANTVISGAARAFHRKQYSRVVQIRNRGRD